MLDAMPASELDEWQQYLSINPPGDDMIIFMLAQLTATVANALRGKADRALSPADFIPEMGPQEEPDWRHVLAQAQAALGGW